MTSGFLFLANLALLLRLPTLLANERCSLKNWLIKGVIELAAILLFSPARLLWGVAALVIGFNVAGSMVHRRRQNLAHLILGACYLVALSILFSERLGLHFRPSLATDWHRVARWTTLGSWLNRLIGLKTLKATFGLLLAANEANLLIRAILEGLEIKPSPTHSEAIEYSRGRIIGLLERGLIYLFVFSGQYAAIGFILAAKGFTRFKKLDDRDFAEYVLIGTLLSSSIAMAIGLLART